MKKVVLFALIAALCAGGLLYFYLGNLMRPIHVDTKLRVYGLMHYSVDAENGGDRDETAQDDQTETTVQLVLVLFHVLNEGEV